MPSTNETFTKMVEVTVQATNREITYKEEDRGAQYVAVVLEYKDAEGNKVGTKRIEVIGDNYQLLMSENPDFAPGKPANEYREQDLFYVIDLIRARS